MPSSQATIFKSIHSRPRIDNLTTERFESEGSDMFYNNIPQKKLAELWRWKVTGDTKHPPHPSPEEAAKIAPSVKINLDEIAKRSSFDLSNSNNNLSATWMGHASFLVQVDGVNILTDPVFSDRASPVQFAGPKRYVPAPCKVEELPRVDIVTISHNHYDHLDTNTVEQLHKHFNPIFVVPRGMKSRWFSGLSWAKTDIEHRVVELGWWKVVEISIPSENPLIPSRLVQVTCVPVQHWTQRSVTDRNKELWGGFVIEHYRAKSVENSGNKFFYYPTTDPEKVATNPTFVSRWFHSGDTGYNEKFFRKIGLEFSRPDVNDLTPFGSPHRHRSQQHERNQTDPSERDPNDDDDQQLEETTTSSTLTNSSSQQQQQQQGPLFDLALIPIGAYHPRWFLQDQHVDPDQAVQIFQDIGGAKLGLGMHWGTFILTDEPLDEPPKLLKECCQKRGVGDGVFIAPKHGEIYNVPLF